MKTLTFLLLFPFLFSCATHRQSQLAMMGGGAITGGIVGASTAPRGEKPLPHGALWAGALGSALGVLSLYLFDSDKEIETQKQEVTHLKAELEKFQSHLSPKLLAQGKNLFKESLPDEARRLISPGEWKKYSVDEWIQDTQNPNTWLHYNLMYEFIPPSLGP